ncbi:MAG: hypothetical protein HY298_19220 [Verrucomicrobia bacterium]|nr:hypothetical protein [Verrucomicrobiota bacterium]
MNAPKQSPKPNCVVQPSDDLPTNRESSSTARKPQTSFTLPLCLMAFISLLFGTPSTRAALLPKNFWVNPAFELGSNLNQTDGTVSNWSRGGGDSTICQVITNNSVSSSHSLAVIDANSGPDGYGEWYSDLTFSGQAYPGDTLDIQWYEMYNLDSPEMRLTVLFFNAADSVVGQTHFVTTNATSGGWVSTIEDSTFTKRNETLSVPLGAVKMRCSLVSGGPAATTGVMIIDDLSVARSPVPNLLFGNFWVNPSFELGVNLDQTNGTPSNWNRGGGDTTIDQVLTNNYASSNHSLAVIDTNTTGSGYGEWYSDVTLSGNASPGDTLNIQWFEMYNISAAEMRLSVLFFDGADVVVGQTHFVTSGTTNAGWLGTIADSTFTKRNGSVLVPTGAVKMRCSLVSGGDASITGVMLVDDLSVARVAPTVSGNFWLNSTFETGTSLDQPTGTPANWNRGGSDGSIDQVTTNKSVSPTHALAVVDTNATGYGEWYADVLLSGHANPGDRLDVQWSEMYGITNGSMRVTVGFRTAGDAFISETSFNVSGNSAGWLGTIAGSTFVARQQDVVVPAGAGKIRVQLASAGPVATVGVMVIDDLTVALHPSTVLAGNFFPNPTFENGDQLDNPTAATPAGIWNRGGGDSSIDQVSAGNSVSPTHSLSLLDNNTAGNGYGEWYGFLTLSGVGTDDVLDLQWFQLYSVTNGAMRLSFRFTDAGNGELGFANDFNTSGESSPDWTGSIATSPFERRNERLLVPAGAVKLRVNFASGGAGSVTGTMLIDDLSVRLSVPNITSFVPDSGGFNLTWDSMPSKTYKVQFATTLGSWGDLATGLASGGLTTSYLDTAIHAGTAGFYRVVQE